MAITNWELIAQQVDFYRQHLDIFIEEQFPPIRLTHTQHIIAREFGNCSDMKAICSRGYGKTFVVALCCHAVCCLYPGTQVIVVSATAMQATLVLGKLRQLAQANPNIANEISLQGSRSYVKISKDHSSVTYKNGSTIESCSMDSVRGKRAKIVVVDQALLVSQEDLDAIVSPLKNFTRLNAFTYGFQDYKSKSISISSASTQGSAMYEDYKRIVRQMAKGNKECFAVALDYQAAIHDGITNKEYFEAQKKRLASSMFQIQYGSIFSGSNANSAFPYSLTDPCRVLEEVQLKQPKGSKARYVISIDVATSKASGADNTIVSVIKFTEKPDGTFIMKLVYMRSFHGMNLSDLSREIRYLYHRSFPNAQRIIYDARGVGDSFATFFSSQWTDPLTNKEFPPLVDDDVSHFSNVSLPILHPVRAVNTLNQRIATNITVALEKHSLQLPISHREIQAKQIGTQNKLSQKQLAVFYQADALQIEMGDVYAKVSQSGNVLYDCKPGKHKDRYSSLSYGVDYIMELQKQNIRKLNSRGQVIGFACNF